jgi:hypothetical protein
MEQLDQKLPTTPNNIAEATAVDLINLKSDEKFHIEFVIHQI